MSTLKFLNEILQDIANEKGVSIEELESKNNSTKCQISSCTRKALQGHWYCWPHMPKSMIGRKHYKKARDYEAGTEK